MSSPLTRWVEPLLIIGLIYVIVASVRRRQEIRDVALSPTHFVLAPVGRRLIAGAIDAVPAIAGAGVAWWQYVRSIDAPAAGESLDVALQNMAPAQMALVAAGCGLYLLHTALGELLAGRSLGKACCGLRVVCLDGTKAGPKAVLVRNALRVIDLAMFFFPLVLILFSPLRQRAGDVAAGTLVVRSGQTQPVEPEAEGDDAEATGVRSKSSAEPDA